MSCLIPALALALMIFPSCTQAPDPMAERLKEKRIEETAQLERLAMKLSAQFKRDLDKNEFSLYYLSSPPATIVLEVRYRPEMDLKLLKKIIVAAEENAKGVARDQFGLQIQTEVDSREILPAVTESWVHRTWRFLWGS